MKNFNINRRLFLKGATASLALATYGAYGLDLIHPQKKLKVGLIGTGWYGKNDLFRLIQVAPVDVVALCDVDKNILSAASSLVQQRLKTSKAPKLYGDYRKMLAENEMDIVIIGTPDHWHALPTIEALKAGAHVYVQKPISVDVMEGEAMLAAARKYNKVVQVGLQRRSTPHLLDAKKNIVDAGLLGRVSHVEMCCYFPMRNTASPEGRPCPITLIMKCGPVRHQCVPSTDCPTSGGGVPLWSTATALLATCVCICSTPCGGCLISAGRNV